ncbi:MAG: hypothetical protein ACREMY_08910, partial [bacterium]
FGLGTRISGSYIDFLPHNLLVQQDGGTIFVDKEWSFRGTMEVRQLLYRALFVLLKRVTAVAAPAHRESLNISVLIDQTFRALGSSLTEDEIRHFLGQESAFQSRVTGNQVEIRLSDLETSALPELPPPTTITNFAKSHFGKVNELEHLSAEFRKALHQRDTEMSKLISVGREQFERERATLQEQLHGSSQRETALGEETGRLRREIQGLQQALERDRAEQAGLREEMQRLQTTHAAAHEALEGGQRDLASLREEQQKSQTIVTALQDALRQHQRELTAARQDLQKDHALHATAEADAQQVRQDYTEARAEQAALQQAAEQSDRQLATLSADLVCKQRELDALAKSNERAEEVCATLRQQLMELKIGVSAAEQTRSEAALLREELDKRCKEREALESTNVRAEEAARVLRRQVMELSAALQHHKINAEALLASTSWRLTAPLRAVVHRLKRK